MPASNARSFGVLVAALSLGVSACSAREVPTVPTAVPRVTAPASTLTREDTARPSPPSLARAATVREGATVALGRMNERSVLYVADEDEHLLRVVDAESQSELSSIGLDGRPGAVLVLPNGHVAVSLRDAGRVEVFGPGERDGVVARVVSRDVAAEPIGLALSPDDARLFVASGWSRTVSVLASDTLAILSTVPVAREPRAIAVSEDGARAFVSHAAGRGLSVIDLARDALRVVGKKLVGVEKDPRENGGGVSAFFRDRVPMQGYVLAKTKGPAAGRVLLPQVLAFPGDASLPSSGGYGGGDERLSPEVFDVAVIDDATGEPLAESLVLSPDADRDLSFAAGPTGGPRRCLLPRAAVAVGRELWVACLGIDEIVVYDALSLRPRDAERRRVRVAEGPTGIAVDEAGARAFVWSQFARAITAVPLVAGVREVSASRSFALPHHESALVDDPVVARGRTLFHGVGNAELAQDGRACASCHPDGRDDGLVWSTPNGPRQTPILAGRARGTAPFSWDGDARSITEHLQHTIERLGGRGLALEDREALAKYVGVMPAPPRPTVANDARVARGAALFASPEVGCATCHGMRGDQPDGLPHDVGSRASADKSRRFDTPSLRFLSGSAPFFHDGRFADMGALLRATDGKMGHTSHLKKDDLAALDAFLSSL